MAARLKMLMAAGGALVALAGCGGGSEAAGESGSGGGGKPTLKIDSPANGANVKGNVEVKFTPSVPIGKEDTGKDHVHFVVDGKTDEYTVVRSSPYTVPNLAPGKHTIAITLQHADHSPAGANAEISVNVTGPGGQAPSSTPSDDGGYDYGGGGGGGY